MAEHLCEHVCRAFFTYSYLPTNTSEGNIAVNAFMPFMCDFTPSTRTVHRDPSETHHEHFTITTTLQEARLVAWSPDHQLHPRQPNMREMERLVLRPQISVSPS